MSPYICWIISLQVSYNNGHFSLFPQFLECVSFMMARPDRCSLFDLIVDPKLTDGLREISELQNPQETLHVLVRDGTLWFFSKLIFSCSQHDRPCFPPVAKSIFLYMCMLYVNIRILGNAIFSITFGNIHSRKGVTIVEVWGWIRQVRKARKQPQS